MTNTRKNICSLTGFKHLNQTKKYILILVLLVQASTPQKFISQ